MANKSNVRMMFKKKQDDPLLELLYQPIYDMKATTAGTSQTLKFFRGLSSTGTLLTTNMTTDGMLAFPHAFYAFGISLRVAEGTLLADLQKLYNESYVELQISGKTYLQIPTFRIPSCSGLRGVYETTVTATTAQSFTNGEALPTAYFPLNILGDPVEINSQQNFQVELKTENTVAFSAAFNVWIFLEGVYARPL